MEMYCQWDELFIKLSIRFDRNYIIISFISPFGCCSLFHSLSPWKCFIHLADNFVMSDKLSFIACFILNKQHKSISNWSSILLWCSVDWEMQCRCNTLKCRPFFQPHALHTSTIGVSNLLMRFVGWYKSSQLKFKLFSSPQHLLLLCLPLNR